MSDLHIEIVHSTSDTDDEYAFNITNVLSKFRCSIDLQRKLNTYVFFYEENLTHESYRRFRNLAVVDSTSLNPYLKNLEQQIERELGRYVMYNVTSFMLKNGSVVKVPWLSLESYCGLVFSSPSALKEIISFNEKYIDPYIDNISRRMNQLKEKVVQQGVSDIGMTPALFNVLHRSEHLWRNRVEEARREGVKVVWQHWMLFSDGFGWMDKKLKQGQWS